MERFYKELPEGYKVYKVIDAKNTKTILWFNIISLLMFFVAIIPFILLKQVQFSGLQLVIPFFLIIVFGMIIYIILHELTHGIVYKFYTKQKLTFGLTLFVAYCGVPNIYVNKKVALTSVLAPFVLYSIILIPILILIPANLIYLGLLLIFGVHFSGCVGDLYVTYILLKSKGKILMNDTGPKQTFYKYEENTIQYD